MKIRRKVETYKIRMFCDECYGEMKQTGLVFPTNPPKYEHRCESCGLINVFDVYYPYFEYEEVDEPVKEEW